MGILDKSEIERVGFASYGNDLQISTKASFYNPQKIYLGSNIRIDDFCVLSAGDGGITIDNNVHIAVFSSIIGAEFIKISDFCNISSRVSIYSSSDDFSGEYLTNPVIPPEFTNVQKKSVILERHVLIGTGSVVLPGVTMNLGAVAGAMSLIKNDCEAFGVYAGIPAQKIKTRSQKLLEVEKKFNETYKNSSYM